jgi:hypothetical protein
MRVPPSATIEFADPDAVAEIKYSKIMKDCATAELVFVAKSPKGIIRHRQVRVIEISLHADF